VIGQAGRRVHAPVGCPAGHQQRQIFRDHRLFATASMWVLLVSPPKSADPTVTGAAAHRAEEHASDDETLPTLMAAMAIEVAKRHMAVRQEA